MGHTDCFWPAPPPRGGVAGFIGAVVVRAGTTDHRINMVIVFKASSRRFSKTTPQPLPGNGSAGIGIERPAVAIGRHNHTRLVDVAVVPNRRPNDTLTGQRRASQSVVQQAWQAVCTATKDVEQAVCNHGRPVEIQLVRHTGADWGKSFSLPIIIDSHPFGPALPGATTNYSSNIDSS